MKKVCFLVGNMNLSGGTERVTSLIANELVKSGYQITILSIFGGDKPFFNLNSNIEIITIFKNEVSLKIFFIPLVIKIREYIKKSNIDSLVVVDSISCVFTIPALWGLSIKHICWEHFNFNINLGIKFRDIGRKWAAKKCDYVVTLTQRDKDLWENNINNVKAKILTINNPSTPNYRKSLPKLSNKTFLAVGRLINLKGFDLLIEAWALVCQNNGDWILRIVGSGEEETNLKNIARSLGIIERVDFVPNTSDIDSYYEAASFFCLSSRFEGLPMVLLEAQSYGLPVISFDCETGPSEIITNDLNGFLIPSNSILELSKSLMNCCSMSTEDYLKMCNASINNINRFKISYIINKWINIL